MASPFSLAHRGWHASAVCNAGVALLLWAAAPAASAEAQATRTSQPVGATAGGSSAAPTNTSTVTGTVYDSIAMAPLPGAIVQLVTDDAENKAHTVTSDWLGQFEFREILPGRYNMGFHHPMLDSLGLEPMARAITVRDTPLRADLAIPSPARVRAAICGGRSSAVLLGFVRDATSKQPLAGVSVSSEWLELGFGNGAMTRRTPRRVTVTGDNGWYAICDVPSPGSMMVVASRGADSTDVISVEVSSTGLLRRELYLGESILVAAAGADIAQGDSAARAGVANTVVIASSSEPRVHAGKGILRGSVTASDGGRPLASAVVSVVQGPQTRTDERGEFVLINAPTGTRTLEVRALGHYPERRAVDIIAGGVPVQITLPTLSAVLERVKVTATRLNSNVLGFQARARSGLGRFVTPADIARRQPIVISEMLRTVPGLFLDGSMDLGEMIEMRSTFGERCVPTVFVNGHQMQNLAASDIDNFARPNEIAGIEVYLENQVPAQFSTGLSGCGSIVMWTKAR